jgi:hypothetical protein
MQVLIPVNKTSPPSRVAFESAISTSGSLSSFLIIARIVSTYQFIITLQIEMRVKQNSFNQNNCIQTLLFSAKLLRNNRL